LPNHSPRTGRLVEGSELNKSDGGKQRKQKDTIIPDSNPDAFCRGKVQKMTTDKGLFLLHELNTLMFVRELRTLVPD
jgi:hypothetical protein